MISFVHIILGILSLALLGFTFLLLETGDWVPFLLMGMGCCALGAAASGLIAYFSGAVRMGDSFLFAMPVLMVGACASVLLFSRIRLPIVAWCAFGLLMFGASCTGRHLGAVLRNSQARGTKAPA